MNSPSTTSSPSYKHLKAKQKQSPVELKEKMRKSYKDKVQNCRNMLLNRFRGSIEETDLRDTLTEIYKSMYNFSNNHAMDEEELEIIEEIKNELVQDELQWWLQEYEKSQMENIDWSSVEQDDAVICLVCQKANFTLLENKLSCPGCNLQLNTQKSLSDIKNSATSILENHNSICNSVAQFNLLSEQNESHIYFICVNCMEMQVII